MKKNEKKKTNKKLLSAFGMFMLSGAMLGTATYAWFTMSREVTLNNIKMTATVPEDLQISLGEITNGSETYSLAKNTGYLTVDGREAKAPTDETDDDPFDWSNSADISHYYQFGKLIPASSTDGAKVLFTPDATGVGKTLKQNSSGTTVAKAYTAVDGSTAGSGEGITFGSGSTFATSHINTSDSDTWSSGTYNKASAYDVTQDDGYYIDIPVWIRTSSTTTKNIYVSGYITKDQNPATSDNDDLYQAVRVAILDESYAAAGGCVDLSSGTTFPSTQSGINTIIDSNIANTNFNTLSGINALTTNGTMAAASYGTVTVNKGATSIGTVAPKSTAQYGPGTKFIIRVWLEGDDVNCWNANAGQDWNISLQFKTEALQ